MIIFIRIALILLFPYFFFGSALAQENNQTIEGDKDPYFLAQTQKKQIISSKTPPSAPEKLWSDSLTLDGFVEGGIAINPSMPFNGLNWGQYYTDRANTPIFNSGVLTLQRPLDPLGDSFDYGFKLQGMIGEDVRYNHYSGILDYAIPSRTQIGPIEAFGIIHTPMKNLISEGGIDIKVGQFVSLNGAETIIAKDNLFYTHNYMFNFGPFLDTGVMVTNHSRDWLDIYTGIITGNNMFIGWPGDNNHAVDFHGGVGLNFFKGDLVIMAITTTGPENPKQTDKFGVGWPIGFVNNATPWLPGGWPYVTAPGWPATSNVSAYGMPNQCACDVNSAIRSWNNLTTTWKVTENFTSITDIAFMLETGWNPSTLGFPQRTWNVMNAALAAQNPANGAFFGTAPASPMGASAFEIAQNFAYKVDDVWLLKARVQYFRDANNFFVSAYPGYNGNVNGAHGFWDPSIINRNITTLPDGWSPGGSSTQIGSAYTGTSYLSFTIGTTITPKLSEEIPYLTGLIIRPEFRWDQSINGASPFFSHSGMTPYQALFSTDIIVPFSIM